MEDDLKTFWHLRDELYLLEGGPMWNDQMFIPVGLRGEILNCLHSAHQGENNMKASARARFFWPGMGAAISQKRRQCRACNEMAPSQSGEEAIPVEVPYHPFADICVDFFHHEGNNFIALCDRYSGFLSV